MTLERIAIQTATNRVPTSPFYQSSTLENVALQARGVALRRGFGS